MEFSLLSPLRLNLKRHTYTQSDCHSLYKIGFEKESTYVGMEKWQMEIGCDDEALHEFSVCILHSLLTSITPELPHKTPLFGRPFFILGRNNNYTAAFEVHL